MAEGYRDGPWMWLGGIGMDPGCGWGGIGMDPGCGWGV